jgi:coenzyme F420 hydrogenase subunit beta
MESASVAEVQAERLDPLWDFQYVKDVVQNELCTFCGACIALCDKIKAGDEVADLGACPSDCPTCVPCPRFELLKPEIEWNLFGKKREDETLGIFLETYTARAKDPRVLDVCQDGGVTTAFLKYLLENGVVDGVVSVKGVEWRPKGFLAKSFEELITGAGTKYTSCPSIVEVARAITEKKLERLAFIGTPCQIQAMRSIQAASDYKIIGEKIKVVVGLFCMESYYDTLLEEEIKGKLGLNLDDITKIDIKGKYMNISLKRDEEPLRVPLKDIKEYTREPCHSCLDFASELADVSIGSVGSPNGWCTVLTRTKLGEDLYRGAVEKGEIESKALEDLEAVRKISKKKQKTNLEYITEKIPKIQVSRRGGINLAIIYRTYRWRSE